MPGQPVVAGPAERSYDGRPNIVSPPAPTKTCPPATTGDPPLLLTDRVFPVAPFAPGRNHSPRSAERRVSRRMDRFAGQACPEAFARRGVKSVECPPLRRCEHLSAGNGWRGLHGGA